MPPERIVAWCFAAIVVIALLVLAFKLVGQL